MGATNFSTVGEGKTMRDAFNAAHAHASYMHGHGGYTGTIAEKTSVVEIVPPVGVTPDELIDAIETFSWKPTDEARKRFPAIDRWAKLYDDKWGPALSVKIGDGKWRFFGFASE